jgi:outer membrane protein assembly factor BamB
MRFSACRLIAALVSIGWSVQFGLIGSAADRGSQLVDRTISGVRWRLAEAARGTPAADSRAAYFLTQTHDVIAVDAVSGAVRWRRTTGERNGGPIGSSLALAGSILVVGEYNIAGFDTADGRVRWRFEPSDGYAPGLYVGSTDAGTVYAGSPSARVYAIDLATGRPRWSTRIADDGKTTVFEPVTQDDLVAAAYTTFTNPSVGGVVVLDAATGRERWRARFPPSKIPHMSTAAGSTILIAADLVLAASGTGVIYAFDRHNGAIRWTLPAEDQALILPKDPARPDFRALTRIGSTVIAGSLTGRINAFDIRTHLRVWRTAESLLGSTTLRIASDNKAAYVPYLGGTLLALSLTDGSELWRLDGTSEEFLSPPRSVDGRLYLSSTKALYCMQR